MPRYKMIALTSPFEGKDAEFNEWYQGTHLPQVCALPGVIGAQRYKRAAPLQDPFDREYLAIYDIETDDIRELLGAFGAAAKSGQLTQTDSADNTKAYTVIFEEFGERVEG